MDKSATSEVQTLIHILDARVKDRDTLSRSEWLIVKITAERLAKLAKTQANK